MNITMSQVKMLRPTWVEIDLKQFATNISTITNRANTKVMLVLKADAYGHGAVVLGKYAQQNNLADMFGVASVEEGRELRDAGITKPVLVLGSLYPFECFEEAIKNNLSVTVASIRAADAVIEYAKKAGTRAICHVKQETGMSRIGARRPVALQILEKLSKSEHTVLEGFYSHLSAAGNVDITESQVAYFEEAIKEAKAKNIDIKLKHICASQATFTTSKHYDMVRIGIGAYGGILGCGLKGILSFKSKIVYIKDIRANVGVSYNKTFVSTGPMRIATIPVGYGDGYLRAGSGSAEVLVSGTRCPVLGNITMDMMMVDITNLKNIDVGSEVVLIGVQGTEEITSTEVGLKANTISYEVTSLITKRVPRLYV